MQWTKEKFIARAQRAADLDNRVLTVWNLNRYSPLYVMRHAQDGDEARDGFIATVIPSEPSQDDLDAIR